MAEPTLLPERLQYRPTKIELDESIEKAKATLLKKIKRSVYVYRVDCGGCNGCEIEIFGSITPVFDVERFGIKVVPSPRHADVLLYTGAVTRAMRMPALRAFEAAPDPKIVVSYGACGCTGGIFYDNYCVWGGTDKILPVDVYIPGCPPSPAQTVYGFAMALGLLDQKLHAETTVEAAGEPARNSSDRRAGRYPAPRRAVQAACCHRARSSRHERLPLRPRPGQRVYGYARGRTQGRYPRCHGAAHRQAGRSSPR